MSQAALITGILAKLTGDATFSAAVGARIYETLPHEPTFPLCLIEVESDEPFNTFGKQHIDADFTVTIQGDLESGRRTLQTTNTLLLALLEGASLTISGHSGATCWCLDRGRSEQEDLDGGAVAIQDTYPRIVTRWHVFATQN